ncbi:MAG: ParB/RepB/Spo0J family partition protein [Candidatus Merdivicinus sp.]|jgi:ParB family chromosome partitioning protein
MAGFFAKEREKVINKVVLVPVDKIEPNPAQPRKTFSPEELQELAESIRENGVLQPVTIRKKAAGSGYELIAGERRLRASKLAGKQEIPAIIVESSGQESAVYAILENIQRKDLNLFEEAKALQILIHEWGVTQEEAARKLGKAQSTIANKLRLLALGDEEQKLILEHHLTERHARALLTEPDHLRRLEALHQAIAQKMNVAQLEQYLAQKPVPPKKQLPKKQRILIVKDVRIFLNTINKAIDTMKNAGIPAIAEKHEEVGCIEYRVRIPLQNS